MQECAVRLTEQTILFNLLCMAIARYTPPVDAHMFEKWFLDQHPKYAGLHDEVVDMSGIEVLEHSRVRDSFTVLPAAHRLTVASAP